MIADGSEELRRLRWQCRRGVLELDLLLLRFLDEQYAELAPVDQDAFRNLLKHSDAHLLEWVQCQQEPPAELRNILRKII